MFLSESAAPSCILGPNPIRHVSFGIRGAVHPRSESDPADFFQIRGAVHR
jgi:hypothetical protein